MSEKISLNICMGSSCFARGNMAHLELIENIIKDYNLDARIDLEGGRCYNKCDKSPHIIVDGIGYENMNKAKIIEVIKEKFPEIDSDKYMN